MEAYHGELEGSHPPSPKDSKAACIQLLEPHSSGIRDIGYSFEDDKLIEDWVRDHVSTT